MEREILGLPGVSRVFINMDGGVLTLEDDGVVAIDSLQRIANSIEPDTSVMAYDEESPEDDGSGEKREIISMAAAGAVFAVALLFGGRFRELSGGWGEYAVYSAAYILAAYPVLRSSYKTLFTRSFLNEFFLMSFASLAAIAIDKFPEAVSVMLFYRVGEFFQERAASRSRLSIRTLIEQKPSMARVVRDGIETETRPEFVGAGDVVMVKPGEKIPIDGVVRDGRARVDTSSLTGESVPVAANVGDAVYGGTVSMDGLLMVEASGSYEDSSVARIMDMVENALARKSPTERFITTFARYYTPAVVAVAIAVALVPPALSMGSYSEWLYRSLVLLVISCPCALVISIPLGYFGGIGAASSRGILVKGGNILDALHSVDRVFFDKTGTLTKGVFVVTETRPAVGVSRDELGRAAAIAESISNHPVARSISSEFSGLMPMDSSVSGMEEAGRGVVASLKTGEGTAEEIMAGNAALMIAHEVRVPGEDAPAGTLVHVARNGDYLGSIVVSDVIRPDSAEAVRLIRDCGIDEIYMLTGDREEAAASVAGELGLSGYRAGLMPDGKVSAISELSPGDLSRAAFVGDGVNDAPALAASGVGIAMGGLGSEAAIEIADAVILDDSPKRIADLLRIASFTRKVVWQNIVFAMGIKVLFMLLGIIGIAGLWEAIFADVGVALLAVLNAARTARA
jgi:Cd2+/Zn2+-exporting ATPase